MTKVTRTKFLCYKVYKAATSNVQSLGGVQRQNTSQVYYVASHMHEGRRKCSPGAHPPEHLWASATHIEPWTRPSWPASRSRHHVGQQPSWLLSSWTVYPPLSNRPGYKPLPVWSTCQVGPATMASLDVDQRCSQRRLCIHSSQFLRGGNHVPEFSHLS